MIIGEPELETRYNFQVTDEETGVTFRVVVAHIDGTPEPKDLNEEVNRVVDQLLEVRELAKREPTKEDIQTEIDRAATEALNIKQEGERKIAELEIATPIEETPVDEVK